MNDEDWWAAARKASQHWHMVALNHAKGYGHEDAGTVPGSHANTDTVAPGEFLTARGSLGREPAGDGAKRKTPGAGG